MGDQLDNEIRENAKQSIRAQQSVLIKGTALEYSEERLASVTELGGSERRTVRICQGCSGGQRSVVALRKIDSENDHRRIGPRARNARASSLHLRACANADGLVRILSDTTREHCRRRCAPCIGRALGRPGNRRREGLQPMIMEIRNYKIRAGMRDRSLRSLTRR